MNLAGACYLLSPFLLASVVIGEETAPKHRKHKQVPASEDIHVPHDEQGLIINRRLQRKRSGIIGGGAVSAALHGEEGQGKQDASASAEAGAAAAASSEAQAAQAEAAEAAEGEEERRERLAAHNEWVERTRERQQLKKASRRTMQERVLTEQAHKEEVPAHGAEMQQDQEQLRTARRQRRQDRIRSAFAAGIAAKQAEDEEAWNFAKKYGMKKHKQGGKQGEPPAQDAPKPKDVLRDVEEQIPIAPGKNMSREKGYAFDLMKRRNRAKKWERAMTGEDEKKEEKKEEEAADEEGERQHQAVEQRRKERMERHNQEVEQLELAKHDRFMQDQRAHQLRMYKRYDHKRQEEEKYERAQAERQRRRIEEKLGKAAEAQRAAAQAIIKPAPKDPFKSVMLEMGAMEQALGAISAAVKDQRFMAAVDAASEALRRAAIKYMHAGERQVETFIRSSENATQRQLVLNFASLFIGSSNLLAQHKVEAGNALMKMRAAMPAALAKQLAPLMATLAPAAQAVRLEVDAASLANMSYIYACSQVREMMEKVIPLNSNLSKVHAVLNTTARYVPMLHTLMPALAPEVHVLAKKIVNLGYTEALALEDVAHALMLKAGAVIEDKFHCTWSARAGPGAGLSLLALAASALATAAAWGGSAIF